MKYQIELYYEFTFIVICIAILFPIKTSILEFSHFLKYFVEIFNISFNIRKLYMLYRSRLIYLF